LFTCTATLNSLALLFSTYTLFGEINIAAVVVVDN